MTTPHALDIVGIAVDGVSREKLIAIAKTQSAEVRRLREENERLRVQLAGCGVAAMQNTTDSRKHRIEKGAYGWSASYADVCSAVDREIALRDENERLRKDAERYLWLRDSEYDLGELFQHIQTHVLTKNGIDTAIDAARGAK